MKLLRENPYFFILFIIFLAVGGFIIFYFPKGEVLKFINQHHTPTLNLVFEYATLIGTAPFALLVIIILALRRYGDAFLGLISFIAAGVLTQFLKRVVFADFVRPKLFFKEAFKELNTIAGMDIHTNFSFPSGHTSLAFAIFCFLALRAQNKPLGLLYFLLAFLTGMSRVYLVQHFFIDVYFGAILGIFLTMLIYSVFMSSKFFNQSGWVNRSLLTSFGFKPMA